MGLLERLFGGRTSRPKYTCTDCEHYAELRTSDKVNPDKTITRGRVILRQCRQSEAFELVDLTPCELFRKRGPYDNMRIAIPSPPKPPSGGSAIKREPEPPKCRVIEERWVRT